jgi:DNA-binding NtrC family response regulator
MDRLGVQRLAPSPGSGLDIAERIRSKGSKAPIILISGYDRTTVASRAEKLNICDFLEKPFSRDVICSTLKKAIGSAKEALELSPPSFPVSPALPKRTRFHFGQVKQSGGRFSLTARIEY